MGTGGVIMAWLGERLPAGSELADEMYYYDGRDSHVARI